MNIKPDTLEKFANPKLGYDFTIRIEIPEFTCLCPKTGQPDFATIFIEYVPNMFCVELKSLKLYITSFRDTGAFHEAVTNEILDTFFLVIKPNFIRIRAKFNVRGGICTSVIAERKHSDWQTQEVVTLP